jgi:ribulose-5-phosphate 4-epimerase/fuculose-1-phosphate aldolase
MKALTSTLRQVASVARLMARAGLVEAFGHVSARTGTGFAITATTTPLGSATAESVLAVDGDGALEGAPLETPLHAAIYDARPDLGAICRTHSPAMVAVGAAGDLPPLTHGLGGLAGAVAFADQIQLVVDGHLAASLAAALGGADCLLMRGNGGLATGESLERAAVRAWYLEQRSRVWLDSGGRATALGEQESGERSRHWPVEAERAWRWLHWRFGEEVG